MKINQTTIDKIKAYILDTQKNSTYNSAPHQPLEMCWNAKTAHQWNLCNCYCYINRYLATDGEKRGNIIDLLKCCHYAWFNFVNFKLLTPNFTNSFEGFKVLINDETSLSGFIAYNAKNCDYHGLVDKFIKDENQVGNFWGYRQYLQLAILLIEQHEKGTNLETM